MPRWWYILFFPLQRANSNMKQTSEECPKPQPPLLLKKLSQCTSNLYCNTPPICIAVFSVPLRSEEREYCQYLFTICSQTITLQQFFWTINFGRRNVDCITEIVLEVVLGAVILTGDLKDFHTVISADLGL